MNAFRFAHPEYLNLLGAIPVLIFLFCLARIHRKKALKRFGNPELLAQLMPNASTTRPIIKFSTTLAAITLIIIGLAQPQFGSKLRQVKRKGVELIVALDVSNSMMAEDIKPNRLERAKLAISKLTSKLKSDKIGLIVFAGKAYTQLPITADYSSAKLFLNSISTDIVPIQGTSIGAALDLAVNSFSPQYKGSKAIIVITDGENHEDDAVEMALYAKQHDIIVHTLGMGLPQGAPIPVVDQYGNTDYRKDREGNTVITKLNEEMLKEIASNGGGEYIRANNARVGLDVLFEEINRMDKSEMEQVVYSEYEDQFSFFFVAALILLMINFLTLERKNKWLKKLNLFGEY